MYNRHRHKHTTSNRRNTHSTHKGTPPTTRIPDKTNNNPHTQYTTSRQTTPRPKKQTSYNNTEYTTNIDTNPNTIVSTYLNNQQHNKVTNIIPLTVHHSETTLPRASRHTLAQPRTNKCLLLRSYLNKIDEVKHPSPLCPLCKTEPHTTTHVFNCTNINTQLQVTDLWTAPVEAGHLLVEWRGWHQSNSGPGSRLDGGIPSAGVRCSTPPPFFGGGVGPTTTTTC